MFDQSLTQRIVYSGLHRNWPVMHASLASCAVFLEAQSRNTSKIPKRRHGPSFAMSMLMRVMMPGARAKVQVGGN